MYYRLGQSRPLPVRHMAPESLLHLVFTTQSDVYAYGVLLFEVFHPGKMPHEELSGPEIVRHAEAKTLPVLTLPPSAPPSFGITRRRAVNTGSVS